MNQRKAKSIRKAVNFHPNDEREYSDITRRVDKDGNPTAVQRIAMGARMVYQAAKKGS